MVQLKTALQAIQPIKTACLYATNDVLRRVGERLNLCEELRDRIEREIQNDPPQLVQKGGVIRDGVNDELDELRHIAYSGKDYLLQIQEREAQQTGIQSLKIGYNNVFGYYLEVRNTYKDKVPQEWVRKQTLAQAERYITQELKEYEEKILGAEDKILSLEQQLFTALVTAAQQYISQVQQNANIIAHLDCLLSAAKTAEANHYVRPVISNQDVIDIRQGRHPVIETQLPIGEHYVPNDICWTLSDSRSSSSRVRIWPVNRRCCVRRHSSCCWPRWAVSCLQRARKSAWWTRYSPVWVPQTIFRWANRRLWWR